MALRKSSVVPEDAVTFTTEAEAATYAWEVVYDWKSLSQTWALRYGPIILGGINAVSGLIINNHYRRRFKLGQYAQFSAGLPVFAMPALLTTLFHNYLVPTDMLLMKSKPCPVCYEIKSTVIQLSLGVAYPMLLAPTAALMFANKYGTYRVPDLKDGPKVILDFVKKHTKPFTGSLAYMTAFQIAAACIITYFEMKNNFTIQSEISQIESKMDAALEEKKYLKYSS